VFVIAEIGVNANGSIEQAFDLVYAAADAGANAVKFQLFRDRPEIENLRFTEKQLSELWYHCTNNASIEFMCTPFYLEAVNFLNPLVKRHKIASGWMKNPEIFNAAVATGKPVIASMGGTKDCYPDNASLLYCVSLYPCPDNKAELWKVRLYDGYSDHTVGTLACVAAVALGAKIIEKHITFDKTAEGPDHACSAEPEEFAEMVKQIRRLEVML
jgi:N-acetylneuraminate synthase/N,N'-diacetyllegionaminate synthase